VYPPPPPIISPAEVESEKCIVCDEVFTDLVRIKDNYWWCTYHDVCLGHWRRRYGKEYLHITPCSKCGQLETGRWFDDALKVYCFDEQACLLSCMNKC
jgi:hypothetical protein